MLRDVVAGFLDTVTEREFDAPLIALLAARGFTDVHFLHGAFEFGKDFIAKGPKPPDGDTGTGDPASWAEHQFAIQSKAGDLGLAEWRAVRPQIDDARLDDLAHPAFDRDLPRAAVLVTTGRLTGAAAVQAGDYRASERRRGRPDFEVWDRERLLEWLADSPEAGLAGTSDGPILALAGAIDEGTVTLAALERRGRAWLPAVPGSLEEATDPAAEVSARQRRAAVEAAVIGNRLRRQGRTDLAAMSALLLLRAAWCHAFSESEEPRPARPEMARAAIRMFAGYALELLDQVEPIANDPRALLDAVSVTAFPHAAYPAACARLAEILGLLGLLVGGPAADARLSGLPAARISRTVADLLEHQPGCHHPLSDGFAVSLIAPVLLTAGHDPKRRGIYLYRTASWTADRYDPEHGGAGLAATSADLADRSGMAAWLGLRERPTETPVELHRDRAGRPCRGHPRRRRPVRGRGQRIPGRGRLARSPHGRRAAGAVAARRARGMLTAGVAYTEPLPPDGVAAPHFTDQQPPVPAWDALALASIARNRHVVQHTARQPAEGGSPDLTSVWAVAAEEVPRLAEDRGASARPRSEEQAARCGARRRAAAVGPSGMWYFGFGNLTWWPRIAVDAHVT